MLAGWMDGMGWDGMGWDGEGEVYFAISKRRGRAFVSRGAGEWSKVGGSLIQHHIRIVFN
jgi:hypothetical protein